MKIILTLISLLINTVVFSQNSGCSSKIFLSQGNQLMNVNSTRNPFTYDNIGSGNNYNYNYNAIGYNPQDNLLYGIKAGTNILIKIDPDTGVVEELGVVSDLPLQTYINGEIDSFGNFYVMKGDLDDILYKINITTKKASQIILNKKVYSADFAFNPTNGLLYGVNRTNNSSGIGFGRLYTINPLTGIVVSIGNEYTGNQTYGAMMGVVSGELYGSENQGGFYQFNINTGERTLISSSPPSNSNDGAHCVLSYFSLGVDLYVTKTDDKDKYTSGTSTTYTITAGNKGPFGTQGAIVSDNVPENIPMENMTYKVIHVDDGATSSIPSIGIGALRDLVSLAKDTKIVYEVTIDIPESFTGDLINTATIDAPINSSTDIDLSNNISTDIDVNKICYKSGNFNSIGENTNIGISNLKNNSIDWPNNIPNGFISLNSRKSGLVITRVQNETMIEQPVEGMLIYNIDNRCVSLYNGNIWNCISQNCND